MTQKQTTNTYDGSGQKMHCNNTHSLRSNPTFNERDKKWISFIGIA